MLDSELKEQLKPVLAPLERPIELVYTPSSHADEKSLLELLEGVASTSSKISVRPLAEAERADAQKSHISASGIPQFQIFSNHKPTGITFTGIPTGHEFTSLIVAILNSDGKGKLPDQSLKDRIQRLKGPIRIKTYISLTCENCPDVVQALNQMALIHSDFQHEMIDGAYVQDEIATLGIQGVPSLVVDQKLIHSGRINLLDLVIKLEEVFGSASSDVNYVPKDLGLYDVVVVGAGPAGAASAIYSVRKGLKTALIAEKFGGQVQDTKGIENLISVTYTEGPQLAAQLHQHVSSYPIQILEHRRVIKLEKEKSKNSISTLHLEGGDKITAKSLILATGAKWRELGIPGEKEYIGRGVAFCPHCDGPYYKGKKISVIGGGNSGVEAAIDLAGIVKELIVFEYNDQLKADQVLVDKLNSLPNVSVVTGAQTQKVIGDGQKVVGLLYKDRKTEKEIQVDLDGIFVQIGLLPNSQFVKDLVEVNKFGEIVIDNKCRTSIPGIYAAGDVTTVPFKQIVIAMGEGAKAALTAFEDSMYNG